MTDNNFEKIFYPTKHVYLANGQEAIEAFSDEKKKGDVDSKNLKRHLVIITKKDIGDLGKIASETGPDALAAGDALAFIQSNLSRHSGAAANTPIPLGNNLFLYISDTSSIKELRKSNKKLNLDTKLQVICQNHDEAIIYRLDSFNADIVQFDKVNPNIRREGIKEIGNDALYAELMTSMPKGIKTFPLDMFTDFVTRVYPNQYLVMRAEKGGKEIVGQVIGDIKWNSDRSRFTMGALEVRIIPDNELYTHSVGIKPRDIGQRLYLHALRQEHISRIFVTGEAACGKTLIGYAGGLEQTLTHKVGDNRYRDSPRAVKGEYDSRFRKIFITKTNDIIGGRSRERGFLPGDEKQKMLADIQSYIDAHSELGLQVSLLDLVDGWEHQEIEHKGKEKENYKELFEGLSAPTKGRIIEIQDYAHWRGRTINGSVIFLDEAQNLHPIEFKHLNQRVGIGSLVIISGDYDHQMDNEKMTKTSNGLFQGLRHYLGQPYAAVVNLEGSYRDAGAEHASRMRVYR